MNMVAFYVVISAPLQSPLPAGQATRRRIARFLVHRLAPEGFRHGESTSGSAARRLRFIARRQHERIDPDLARSATGVLCRRSPIFRTGRIYAVAGRTPCPSRGDSRAATAQAWLIIQPTIQSTARPDARQDLITDYEMSMAATEGSELIARFHPKAHVNPQIPTCHVIDPTTRARHGPGVGGALGLAGAKPRVTRHVCSENLDRDRRTFRLGRAALDGRGRGRGERPCRRLRWPTNGVLLPLREKVPAKQADEGSLRCSRDYINHHRTGPRDPSSVRLRRPPSPARGEGFLRASALSIQREPILHQGRRYLEPNSPYFAPAFWAQSQAILASAGMRAPLARACGLLAVPSRTRPTMPCRMPARRKPL